MTGHLNAPHGGELVNAIATADRAEDLRLASLDWQSWDLTDRQLCDLELIMNGAFSPLAGFMGRTVYESVRDTMRMPNGTLWTIPITLDVTNELADRISEGEPLALRDPEGVMLATLHVDDIWQPDKEAEAEAVFGTRDPEHPGVASLLDHTGEIYLGGRIEGIHPPVHHDYKSLRLTPAEVRDEFTRRGWTRVAAFQARNPMHRIDVERTRRASSDEGANLLLHPVVGMTKPGDIDHYTRVRCYRAVLDRYPYNTATLALLPLAMRMGGPREAIWHAIIRKNYGCTHLIVERDHAGPGEDSKGNPFYGPHDAQRAVSEHEEELGVKSVVCETLVYVPEVDAYLPADEVADDTPTLTISSTDLRTRLDEGREIPEWFSYPEVIAQLRRTYPPRPEQGFTVFFTGLSGSGKSTMANALLVKLLEMGSRRVTLLDGDIVRKNLSSELGFSKEHRDINIHRIGFVAREITKNGGVAICAPIAPYDATRKAVRNAIEEVGGFILVHVATPLEVCEARDRKGLYAKARAGLIPEFTGISDPYEEPDDAELVVDSTELAPDEAANQIILHLERLGYVGSTGV